VIDYLWKMGQKLCENVNSLFERYGVPLVYQGAWPAMVLVEKEDAVKGKDGTIERFFRLAFKHGIALYKQTYMNFSHKEKDINETLERWERAIKEL